MTDHRRDARNLARYLLFLIACTLATVTLLAAIDEQHPSGPPRPTAAGSPAELVERYGCWTGDAPEGVEPRHAVVTWPGRVTPSYGGRRTVQAALAHLFEGKWRGIVVHAFCP